MIPKIVPIVCGLCIVALACGRLCASQYKKVFEEQPTSATTIRPQTITPYTIADKKLFEDLINVWYTKKAGGARKVKRIEDLKILSALMIRDLIATIRSAGLTEKIKTSAISKMAIQPALTEGVRVDLANANIYAIFDFKNAYDKITADTSKRKGTVLLSESDRLHALIKALEVFNINYGKVNKALREMEPSTSLPREVTLGWLESFEAK